MKPEKMMETMNNLLKSRTIDANLKDKLIDLSDSIMTNYLKVKEIKEIIKFDNGEFDKLIEQAKKDALNFSLEENPEFIKSRKAKITQLN
jgi:rRNA pseudouridine-1189 N-methylase Emg1 (Nep1/Mra1 family)